MRKKNFTKGDYKAEKKINIENFKFVKNESFDIISPKSKKYEIEGNNNYTIFLL
jgi:hypothetical protein